jgi:hypothetical protein
MKVRVQKVSTGYVPQVQDTTKHWKGLYIDFNKNVSSTRYPDLQLRYCSLKTLKEAETLLSLYKEQEEGKDSSVHYSDLVKLSSN